MKRVVLLLIVASVAAVAIILADRNLRLGRDLIFYSSDVVEFTLPNGKAVLTNRWYDRRELLGAGVELYCHVNGLGLMPPGVEGFATFAGEGGEPQFLDVPKQHTTRILGGSAGQGATEDRNPDGYDEWWVRRQGSKGGR
jgi:hypothetical protein